MAVINDYNGIFCVYKPQGFTSFDVIAKMRGILKMKRLGHAGTLDPMAEGVLPVFAGSATKACDMLPDHDKVYHAGFKLGIVTDTQDITGKLLSESLSSVCRDELDRAAEGFKGEIMQIPPMFSAVSVNGKRLYDLARQGIEIEREPRSVTIYSLDITDYNESERTGHMDISCSKGTYIRTVINDIGEKLGCGGVMTSLVRTAACGFTLDSCVTLEQLQQIADGDRDFSALLLPVDKVFDFLPKIRLCKAQERMYRNGIRLDINRISMEDKASDRHAVYGSDGNFLGTAVVMRDEGLLRIEKNFY